MPRQHPYIPAPRVYSFNDNTRLRHRQVARVEAPGAHSESCVRLLSDSRSGSLTRLFGVFLLGRSPRKNMAFCRLAIAPETQATLCTWEFCSPRKDKNTNNTQNTKTNEVSEMVTPTSLAFRGAVSCDWPHFPCPESETSAAPKPECILSRRTPPTLAPSLRPHIFGLGRGSSVENQRF